jgi:hypothetical protein
MNFENIGRNLIFTSSLDGFIYRVLDIGKELSQALSDKLNDERIAIIAEQKLHEIIERRGFTKDEEGSIYALKNIGILFEPQLKIDFKALCKRYSRDSYLVIEHTGEIDNKNLYFLTRDAGIKMDLSDLNYTVI